MSLSAAKSRVGFARDNLESGRTDGIESMLDAAEGFLSGVTEDEAAPVLAEIVAIRTELAGRMSPEDELAVRGAQYKVKQVVGWVEMNFAAEEIEAGLRAAEELVAGVPDVHKAAVLAEIAALRPEKAEPQETVQSKERVKPTDEEESLLRRARSSLMWAREPRGELSKVDEADALLQGVRDEFKGDLLADIAVLRAEFSARISDEDALAVSGARGKLRMAVDRLDGNYGLDEVDGLVRTAEMLLVDVPDMHKAAARAEIAALRVRVGGSAPVVPRQPAPAVHPEIAPTEDESALLRRARTSLMWARENNDQGKIAEAEGYLAQVRDEHRAELLEEIASIRAKIAEAEAAERVRQATTFIDGQFPEAERGSASAIAYCFGRLNSEELRAALPPAMMQRYQDRLAAAFESRVAGLRASVVQRSEPHLLEIEEHLVPDLFVGLEEGETFAIVGQCENLRSRVEHELWAATNLDTYAVWAQERDPVSDVDKRAVNARLVVPQDDPVLSGVRARLTRADLAISDALAAWRKVQLVTEVATHWSVVRDEFAGWREETARDDRQPFEPADLPLTYLAIVRTRSLLAEPRTVEVRLSGHPAVEATYQEVERELGAALAKADAAINQVLDEASQATLPLDEGGLAKLADTQRAVADGFASDAERSLADSAYLAPVLMRIRRLDERWQADIAAAIQQRQALYDKLSAEAAAAWPGIVSASGATTDFDPTSTPVGTVVLLHQVYNRAGWEFNGCDFALRWDATPVGGSYVDEVRKALEHAWYDLKLDVNDRIRWDLLAVVEGQGSIGERTNRVVRDASTGRELGKVEEWPPVACTWLRVVGLHAGPVAVGP